jgi:hypothetical protein
MGFQPFPQAGLSLRLVHDIEREPFAFASEPSDIVRDALGVLGFLKKIEPPIITVRRPPTDDRGTDPPASAHDPRDAPCARILLATHAVRFFYHRRTFSSCQDKQLFPKWPIEMERRCRH